MTVPGEPPEPDSVAASTRSWLARFIGSVKAAFGNHPPDHEAVDQRSANALALERTSLATDRTLMAADRSLMAWIRTALSMISFGFTIYKLLQGFAASGTELADASSPRAMGLLLTGLGTLAMVCGTIEYWYRLQELRRHRYFSLLRPSFVISQLMSVIGLFLFVAIIFKAL